MGVLRETARRRTMRRWAEEAAPRIARIPRASDAPQVHTPGEDADRVLLLGSGIAVGYGTTSHDEALPGMLARALSDLTGRGTDIDVLADRAMTLASATSATRGMKLWRFDVIVVALGSHEAVALQSTREWRAGLRRFLKAVRLGAVDSARIVLLGIPSLRTLSTSEDEAAQFVDERARELDSVTASVAVEFDDVLFVPLDAALPGYLAIGEALADAMLDELNTAREASAEVLRGPAGQDPAAREAERQAALDSLGVLDTPPEDRFDRIVSMAQKLFGTDGAAFTIVDSGRVWHKSRIGVAEELPRDTSFCDLTIRHRGAHIVHDVLTADARLLPGDSSARDQLGIRFYAGYPVESPSGEAIGALCVFDSEPRGPHDVDESLLRQLALLIQAELRVKAI